METNVLTNVSLNTNQKQLLVRMMSAATPLLAGKEVRNGSEAMTAAKVMIDLGLISYNNEEAVITDTGLQKMKDENLIDQSNQLTQYGNSLVSSGSAGNATAPPPEPQTPDDGLPSLESFSLIRDLSSRAITE